MAKKPALAGAKDKFDKLEDAAARWQKIRIEQVGFTTNVLIGLAAGLIALEANLAFGKMENISVTEKHYLIYSIGLLLISIITGIALAFNRLYDFSITFNVVRFKQDLLKVSTEAKKAKIDEKISWRRELTKVMGKISRAMLFLQSVLFIAATFELYLAVREHLRI